MKTSAEKTKHALLCVNNVSSIKRCTHHLLLSIGISLVTGCASLAIAQRAADAPIPFPTSAFTFAPDNAPAEVAAGQSAVIAFKVNAATTITGVLINAEIQNTSGEKQLQTSFTFETFVAGREKTYSYPFQIPADLAPGEYRLAVGAFDSGWRQHAFNPRVHDFRVVAPTPAIPDPRVQADGRPRYVVRVNASAERRPISPLIYGVNFGESYAAELNVPINRSGGNATSRYNWRENANNRGSDWFFQSIAFPDPTPAGDALAFVRASQAAGAQPMYTIPTNGWVARVGAERAKLWSFSIAKYGPQPNFDREWSPDSGDGRRADGTFVDNDPEDANQRSGVEFQAEFVRSLVRDLGTAASGGLRYYLLDNEPGLWTVTHRDVHRSGYRMRELRDRVIEYGSMIKSIDPSAVVVGPEEWGWVNFWASGADYQLAESRRIGVDAVDLPDRVENGGWSNLPWLLDQLRRHEESTGRRVLDVFTVHHYPSGKPSHAELGDDVSPETQLLRNRSVRSFWDPNFTYTDSWIEQKVNVIGRMREWVDNFYPGTKIGITEYDWGANHHINGATAQADILGFFGREGLDLANKWMFEGGGDPRESFTYKAIKLYRNYDGRKSTFGDVSVAARSPDPDTVATYAAVRSQGDRALTIMVINKSLDKTAVVTMPIEGFVPGGQARVWRLDSSNAIRALSPQALQNRRLIVEAPAQSITLYVVPPLSALYRR